MRTRTCRTLAVGIGLAVVGTGSALAGPVNGATYVGSLPAYGTATYHHLHLRLHSHGASIVLLSLIHI